MSRIRWDDDRRGLEGLPGEFVPVARDDLGDVLAHDAAGVVFCFPHGCGDWQTRSRAFASLEQLRAYVDFQEEFEIPDDLDLAGLRRKKQRIGAFAKTLPRAPYAREAIASVLADLREAIADRRFAQSKPGRDLAARHELSRRCEEALTAAGDAEELMIRPYLEPGALVVMARFDPPWTEAFVQEVLRPLLGRYRLVFRVLPSPP